MDDLQHECGVAALYHLPGAKVSPLVPDGDPRNVTRLMPRMLIDLQNRGQLAAGLTSYDADRDVICMRHFEQLSNQEVAAVLGLTEAASSMRYLRALRRLVNYCQPPRHRAKGTRRAPLLKDLDRARAVIAEAAERG